LEIHLLGNHYMENGSALAFVGSCFEGPAAERWLSKGIEILESEIPEQIFPDGMHFELSPMYHSRILYLLSIMRATNHSRLRDLVDEPIDRMTSALRNICHPDGQISLLNDSAFRIYNDPKQLLEYGALVGRRDADSTEHDGRGGGQDTNATCRLQSGQDRDGAIGAFSLPDAGYYGWRDECGNYLILDAGHVGPDYQPGHAHADFGSYELSLNGRRVIVDSGVHDYEYSELRRYSRSTAAHNTVEINGQNQSEVWGTFRVARRGKPLDVSWKPLESGFELSGSHNGYDRVKGRPRHTRKVKWDQGTTSLHIQDRIISGQSVACVSRIHLHPDCEIVAQEDKVITVQYPEGKFIVEVERSYTVENGWYFPEFGKKLKHSLIVLPSSGRSCEISYTVTTFPEQAGFH
jgi:uncharacterized heparinase superfamily protein